MTQRTQHQHRAHYSGILGTRTSDATVIRLRLPVRERPRPPTPTADSCRLSPFSPSCAPTPISLGPGRVRALCCVPSCFALSTHKPSYLPACLGAVPPARACDDHAPLAVPAYAPLLALALARSRQPTGHSPSFLLIAPSRVLALIHERAAAGYEDERKEKSCPRRFSHFSCLGSEARHAGQSAGAREACRGLGKRHGPDCGWFGRKNKNMVGEIVDALCAQSGRTESRTRTFGNAVWFLGI